MRTLTNREHIDILRSAAAKRPGKSVTSLGLSALNALLHEYDSLTKSREQDKKLIAEQQQGLSACNRVILEMVDELKAHKLYENVDRYLREVGLKS